MVVVLKWTMYLLIAYLVIGLMRALVYHHMTEQAQVEDNPKLHLFIMWLYLSRWPVYLYIAVKTILSKEETIVEEDPDDAIRRIYKQY